MIGKRTSRMADRAVKIDKAQGRLTLKLKSFPAARVRAIWLYASPSPRVNVDSTRGG